jgi:hypothetical protein
MKMSLIREVEARFGQDIESILQGFVDEGVTKKTACERLKVTKNTLLKWVENYGIEWPIYTKERKDRWKQVTAERTVYTIEHNGVVKPLFQAAEEEGLPLNLVLERYKKGDRGERLFRKARSYKRNKNHYDLDLTMDEWKVACDLAREIGVRKAARKLYLPMSAISYALKGQYHRIG